MSLLSELKRRNVFRIGFAYIITAWLVVQIAELAATSFFAPDWVMKMIITMLILGFPVALVMAWAYELTPEGLRRDTEAGRLSGQANAAKLNRVIMIALLLVVVYFSYDKFVVDPGRGQKLPDVAELGNPLTNVSKIDSIAVLAFEDFSEGGEQAHLAVGLADEVLHILAQIPDLRVTARTSSFSFRGTGTNVTTIGKELGVGAVLEGSVQRSGDTLRIIAQLIRVSDQSHLWSQTFDRPTGDIFAIQDEIAQAVADALRPSTADNPAQLSSERTSLKAYEHFLRGNDLWRLRSKETIEKAIEEFEAAIAADPRFAAAHAGLAMAYIYSSWYGDRTLREVQLLVQQEIERALAIEPDSSLAYAARGVLSYFLNRYNEAEVAYRRAIELNPSDATVHAWLAVVVGYDDSRLNEERSLLETAYELDPRNQFVLGQYGNNLAFYGDYEGALALYRRGITLEPEAPRPYSNIARLHTDFGRYDDAIRASLAQIERAPGSPEPYMRIAASFLDLDDQETAQEWFNRARELNPNLEYWPNWFLREQDLERMVSEMQVRLTRDPDNPNKQGALCYAYLLSQQYELVQAMCGGILAEVLGPESAPLKSIQVLAAKALYWAAKSMGDTKIMDRLLSEMTRFETAERKNGAVNRNYESDTAIILGAFRGDRDTVIARLKRAVELGYLRNRSLAMDPWWGAYREDPEFQVIVEDIRNRQMRQLNALRAEGL